MEKNVKSVTQLRNLNRYRILEYMHSMGISSKIEMVKDLKLSAPTISRNVNPYIGSLIKKSGKHDTKTRGRKADTLEFNYNMGKILSIQVDKDHLAFCTSNLSREIIDFKKTPISHFNREHFLDLLSCHLRDMKDDVDIIVVGLSGYLNRDNMVMFSFPGLNDLHINSVIHLIKERFPDSIIGFENDANLLAVRESYNYKQKWNNLVCIYWGEGLGMGIVIDGNLYRGKGRAGELGRTLLSGETLETRLSGLKESEQIQTFQTALYNIALLMQPDAIILNGPREAIFEKVTREWQMDEENQTALIISRGGEKSVVEGGISLGISLYLKKLSVGRDFLGQASGSENIFVF